MHQMECPNRSWIWAFFLFVAESWAVEEKNRTAMETAYFNGGSEPRQQDHGGDSYEYINFRRHRPCRQSHYE